MGTGIFTDFERNKPETSVKKSKTFKQSRFIRGFHPVDDNSQSTLGFQDEEEMKDESSAKVTEEDRQPLKLPD